MTARDVFLGVALGFTALALAPLAQGVIFQFEGRGRGRQARRRGIFQPYRDLWRLLGKLIVAPRRLWAKPMRAPKFSAPAEIDAFLEAAANLPATTGMARGRLIFALDATMRRQAIQEIARGVQGRMFATAAAYGGIDVQIVYFRGVSECKASPFTSAGQSLATLMSKLGGGGGLTQIEKVLRHALEEARKTPVRALVFVGDAMEERLEVLTALAGELGQSEIKAFLFQAGRDSVAEQAFQEMARQAGGAYAAFDLSAPERLVALLSGAGAYAAGGARALEYEARVRGVVAAEQLLSQICQTGGIE